MKLVRESIWAAVAALILSGVFSVTCYAQNTSGLASQSVVAPMSVNRASVEELQALDGIGVVIAERIVEYREDNGSFEVLDDLMDVGGIGQVKFERLKNKLTL